MFHALCMCLASTGTCDTLRCSGDKQCRVRNGQARCVCAPDCDAHSGEQRAPVCGSDGHTYASLCSLLKYNCKRGRNTRVNYYGRCRSE